MHNLLKCRSLWLEKCPNKKGMMINLDNMCVPISIRSSNMQPTLFKHRPEQGVWTVITGAVLFGDLTCSINSRNTGAWSQQTGGSDFRIRAGEGSNQRDFSIRMVFRMICLSYAQDIPGVFNNHMLTTAARS